jgi:hypothetical protein
MLRSDGGAERLASGKGRRYGTAGQFTSNHMAEVLLNELGFVSVFINAFNLSHVFDY